MYKTLKKIYKTIDTIEKYIIGAMMLIVCALIFYVIINRIFKGQGIHWLEECSRGLLIVTTYFCGCVATSEDRLTKLTLVTDALPKRAALIFKSCTNALSAVFMLWIGYAALTNTIKMKTIGTMTTSLGCGVWVLYTPLMIGMFGLGLRLIFAVWTCIRDLRATDKNAGKASSEELFEELMEKGE